MLPNLGGGEWMIILLVVLLLFGSAKLPALARSLGKSARILKAETKGIHDDDDAGDATTASAGKGDKAAGDEKKPVAEPASDSGAAQRPRGALASGEPIQGVPVSDPGQARKSD
ncbi:twin-arginine translocase TatA/TatE family subunit [Actinomadura soli]|uniref:Sec-independent protein translocase protein TatA n=1 Tax=Actinomadura soli TaxID=2508997 RepID=A0A5C4JDY5_9ACTN|nr:Sec-independent protein translocase subunit TatA [Actinomadura soli]TMR01925.1 twin-arginine translocase TatA/TatE family subunit [Actinomadura soli]